MAGESPPGANGVLAVPWLDGARAPWWRDDARAGFMGLSAAHEPKDLARARRWSPWRGTCCASWRW